MPGKNTKTGKDRLDKYYQLAKDQGYRARSAFKLVQLAKKTNFLTDAKVCIDLCGAPGGWSQVAAKNMARGSKIICVDLAPIKPIPGVVGMVCDITTPKCRQMLRKELNDKPVDLVLNDGAPNVGANWAKDAYVQNELTLHATKLAADFLKVNGNFVTKVFRSADYTSLLWVFQQLFHKVEATKPQASRNVSAEIFVICQGYKGNKNDPKLFDPKYVFMESKGRGEDDELAGRKSAASLADLLKYQTKKHRGGYEEGDDFRQAELTEFMKTSNPANFLCTHNKFIFETKESQELHATMTDDMRSELHDLKVLGKGPLTKLIKWRGKILRAAEKAKQERQEAEKEAAKAAGVEGAATGEDAERAGENEEQKVDREISELVEKMRREEKREAKKRKEVKKKFEWRKKISMNTAMSGPANCEEPDLFKAPLNTWDALREGEGFVDEEESGEEEEQGVEMVRKGELVAKARRDLANEKKLKTAQDFSIHSDDESSDDGSVDMDVDDERLERLAEMEAEQVLASRERQEERKSAVQRSEKNKKETRRQRKFKEWGEEMASFSNAIDVKAEQEHGDAMLADSDCDTDDEDDAGPLNSFPLHGESDVTQRLALEGELEKRDRARKAAQQQAGAAGAAGAGAAGEQKQTLDPEQWRELEKTNRWFSQDMFGSLMENVQDNIAEKDGARKATDKDGDALMNATTDDNAAGSDSDADSESESFKGLADHELPMIPLNDKERRKLKNRKAKEKEEKRKERDEKKNKKGKKGDAIKDADEANVNVVTLDDGVKFETVGRDREFDEDLGDLLPGQESQKMKKEKPAHLQQPTDKFQLASTQALGTMMIRKKSRMDLLDSQFNRYNCFNDEELDLPEWFLEDESSHNKPELPVTKELMDQFRDKIREINCRPIRKVAEANARKKKRLDQRMEKVRKEAKALAQDAEMHAGAKARNMERLLRKAKREGQDKSAKLMAIKKAGGNTDVTKGKKNLGGRVKTVDKRMKTDKRGDKVMARKAKKGGKKGNRKSVAPKQKQQAKMAAKKGKKKRGGKA